MSQSRADVMIIYAGCGVAYKLALEWRAFISGIVINKNSWVNTVCGQLRLLKSWAVDNCYS